MDTDNRWRILTLVHEWIRFADLKAGAILAADGVLGGVVIAKVPHEHTFRYWGLIATLLLIGVSILTAVASLNPSLGKRHPPTSLVYFGHIARKYKENYAGFEQDFSDLLAQNQLDNELTSQIWVNSKICQKKFMLVNISIIFLVIALLATGISIGISKL